jgi:hypothetical protein
MIDRLRWKLVRWTCDEARVKVSCAQRLFIVFGSVGFGLLPACGVSCPPDTELHSDDDQCHYLAAGAAGSASKKPATAGNVARGESGAGASHSVGGRAAAGSDAGLPHDDDAAQSFAGAAAGISAD